MNATLSEIIAKKKQKELEAAQLAEKLSKAKRYKELKRKQQQNAISSSANSVSSCSTSSATQHKHSSKENKNPNNVLDVSPDALKASNDLHTDSKFLRKAGALVRDSQDPHTPIWVPGFSYPAQYCIRQTRSLSQKLQVDNVDCIDLDDCMFGSQRAKVKVEDCKSDSGSVTSEHSTKSLKRKTSRRTKRRRRSNKLSQTSDSSDCGVKLESEQQVDVHDVMQSSFGDVSVMLMDEPVVVTMPMTQQAPPMGGDCDTARLQTSDDDNVAEVMDESVVVTTPMTQQAPSMGGDCDTAQLQTTDDENMAEPLTSVCNNVISSAQQPMACDNDIPLQVSQQPTGGSENTDTPVPHHTESNNVTRSDASPLPDLVEQSMGNNDSTLYGLTESILLLIDTSCDQQTGCVAEARDQEPSDTANACQFWCEKGSNLNSKVSLCKNDNSSQLHCSTVLKHTIGGDMVPLLKVSNIASSSISDDSDNFYISVQLTGHIVLWLHSFGWTALSHWAVPDELDLIYFYTLSLTGGVAVCMMTKTGTCRISFVKEDTTLTPQPVIHCISNNSWHSSVVCCWTSRSELYMAISCRDKIEIQAIEHYSEKVKKQICLPFNDDVYSLCGVVNNSTTDDEGVWLFAATPTGIAIFDIVNKCLLQNISLSCSNTVDCLLPKCLRAIREDCYTFIVLGYEYQKKGSHKVVGWLVAIDNSDDTRTPLPLATNHQTVSYAKLLREYTLPQSFPNCDSFNYLSAIHNDQLVVAVTDTHSQTLHSWNQFTGVFTNAWTISSPTGFSIQSNSTVLALYSNEEDWGNLYICELDKS